MFVVQSLGDGADLGLTDVVFSVALMAQIGGFNHVGVHQGDAALEVDPAQGRDQEFSQLGADASSTDQKQIPWGSLLVHTGVTVQAFLKNPRKQRYRCHF